MKKRIISILLCLTMFVTLLPATAWADNANDPDPQEEVIQEQPSPEEGEPVSEEPESEEDEPAPALTAPEIEERLYDEETSEMLLSVPGEWDSYAWEAYFGGEWIPCDEETSAEMVLSKEVYVQYGFRCTVTKDGQSVTSKPYAYDDAVWESSDITRYDVRNRGSDALTASSSYIKFYQNSRNRFDIHGVDNGKEFKTTFMDGGYRTAISVADGSKVDVAYTGAPVTVDPSLTAQTALSLAYGDRYVKITYTVTNSGSTTKDFRIGSSADVMIDNNDKAEVKGSTTGLTMSGSPKNSYTFNLVAPTCDTLWYGYWTQAYDNVFTNRADRNTPYNKDSGMAWSWSGSVAPGETWTRYVLIGAGALPPSPAAPSIPGLDTRTVTAGATEAFTGTGQAGTTVHITVCGQEDSAVVGDNGNFTANILIPANYPDATAAVNYWATSAEGGISEMNTATVKVLRQPQINLTASAATVMEEESLSEIWYTGFIKSSVGNVTHTNVDTSTPGTYTVTYTATATGFSAGTATLTVTVLPKPAVLTQTTVTGTTSFALKATMTYTGGMTYTETGFVYGALQNPTLALYDGKVTTSPAVNTKGGTLSATLTADQLTEGITYYARAYAKASDGTVIYGAQSSNFGLGVSSYGAFSVANSGSNTFTITRTGGSDGAQTVYFRTVNGSAIGGTHFTHKYGTLTFTAKQTSQTVTVTELGVAKPYGSNAATAYSNADRTYSLEIYRVTGGATIGTSTATRTMAKDETKTVNREIFNKNGYAPAATEPSGQVKRGDYDSDRLGWADNNRIGSTAQETIEVPNDKIPQRDYWENVGSSLGYYMSFYAWEEDDGYQHVQVALGDKIDTAFYPYTGEYRDRDSDAVITSLTDGKYTAICAATFQHGGSSKNTTRAQYSLPGGTGGIAYPEESNMTGISKKGFYDWPTYLLKIPFSTKKITVGFGASGSGNDKWYTDQLTHHFSVLDTEEPQLLGIAPMAGGTYLPGDKVTISLVFDEIVDKTNSSLTAGTSYITTNWGKFYYAGGANTNVLYFTGTVPEGVSGTITLTTLNCAGQIKDMCGTAGTASSGSGSSNITVGSAAKPTVSVGAITNSNGTLTATITAANAGKLEYVWSTEPTAPAYGWKMLTNTSSATVTTRQTSGTWYLHARATNADGWTVYDYKSFTLSSGSGAVTLPDLTLSVYNTDWATTRTITLTKTPSSAEVTVSGPGITGNQTVSGTTYTANQNGVYTFTLTSGGDTVTKTATVSKLDTTAPTVTVHDLANRNHTEKVTLTVTAADTESGVSTVTGTWSNGSSSQNAAITANGDGTWTTTSPDESGTWTLSVTATDTVGNSGTVASAVYTINAIRPTLTVTKQSETTQGVTYSYSVADNGNTGVTVQLPDGTTTTETSGTFTITEPGTYTISVTDAAGHFVSKTITVDAPISGGLDGVKPDVRCDTNPWTWTNQDVTVTVNIYEAGGLSKVQYGGTDLTYAPVSGESGSYTASFTVTANGAYTVTATDAAGNVGTATVGINFIDKTQPTMTAKIGSADIDGSKWYSAAQTVILTAADAASGVKSVEYAVTETKTAPTNLTTLTNGGAVTVSGNGTHYIYYKVTDNAQNVLTGWTNAININTAAPTVTLTADKTTATYNGGNTAITLTANVSHAASGLTYTYEWYKGGTKLDGQTASTLKLETVADSGTYTVKVTASKDSLLSNQAASNPMTVSITKATPSISTKPTASAIAYGQSLSDSTLSGTANTTGIFAWANGTIKPAVSDSGTTAYNVTFTPDDTRNYNTATTTATLTVNKAILTPSVNTVESKEYDGTDTATGTLTLSGAVPGETPNATGTFAFTDKNVGTAKKVNVTGITLDGTWGDNYQLSAAALSEVSTTAAITAKTVGLTWSGHTGLTYTGNPVSVTATATGLIGEDACTVIVKDGDKTDAETYTAEATTLSNANYKLPAAVTQSYTIAKAPVSFAVTNNTHPYDGGNKAAVVTQTADQTPSVSGYFTVSYKQGGTTVTPKDKGTYEIWVTLDSTNFKFAGQEDADREMKVGTLTIGASEYPNTITWPTATGLIYGQPLSASTLSSTEAGGTFAWKEPTTIPTVSNSGYTVVFTPTDTSYNPMENTVAITVTAKELTITGAAATSRAYEPYNTTVTVSGGTLVGVVTGDTVTLVTSGASGTVGTADAGENKPVTVTGYALTGADAGDYTLKQPENVTVTISPAAGGGSVTMEDWTYGETASSPVPTSDKNGIANVTYHYTGRNGTTYNSDTRPTDAGDYTVTATFAATNNYKQATTTADFTIGKATPTISALNASAITYGESLSDSTLSGTANTTGIFAWANGTIKPAVSDSETTAYNVTFTPNDTRNYNTATTTVKLTVNKAILTPSVNTVESKEYDGTDTATGTLTLSGAVPGETPTATGTFAFTDKNVGTAKKVNVTGITLDGTWGDNYQLSAAALSEVSTTAAITAKTVGLTWSGHTGLTYTGNPVSVTAMATGLIGEDACTVTVKDGDKTDAETYTAEATTLSNANYKLPAAVTQSYTIAKAPVSFVVTNNTHPYDGTDKTATVTQTVEQTPAIGGQFTVSYKQGGTTVTPKAKGTYEVWVTLTSNNFKFENEHDTTRAKQVGTLTISDSDYPYTIAWPTAEDLTYGQRLTESDLTSAESNGTFAWKEPTTIPTVSNSGYTVVFTPMDTSYNPMEKTVSITVAPKELTITGASASNRDYIPDNTTVAVSGGTLVGVVTRNGVEDAVALDASNASGTVENADAEQNKPVTVAGYVLTGTDAGNYTLTQPTDVTVTIIPAEGGGSVTMEGWTYDGTAKNSPVPTSDKNGIANVTYHYNGRNGTTYDSAECPTDAGDYNVTAIFPATNNYTQATATADFTIGKATPTISAISATAITYGQSLSDSTLSGTANMTGIFAWANGTIKPAVSDSGTTAYNVTFTPDDTRNYNTATTTVKLTVNKAILTPSVNTVESKEYDGTDTATGTLTLSGAVPGETPTATGTFAFTDKNVGTAKKVNVTGITLDGTWGDNYQLSAAALSEVSTTAAITAKTVGLTWSGHTGLTYTGNPVSVTATATGLIGEDVCTVTVSGGAETDAGTHTATATALSNSNYKLPAAVTQSYTIAKAPVSFVVTNNTHPYDGTDKTATVTQTADQTPSVSGYFTVSFKQGGTTVTPKAKGTYEIWVTLTSSNFKFAEQDDTTRTMKVGTLTIDKKAAMAVWTNLTQVYDGRPKTPTVTLTGQVAGDGSSFTVSAATNAGTHTVTLTPQNPAAESYIISNPTATMIIQKAPVILTVTNNAAQYNGSAHTATVTASPAVAHTVTYRQNGQTVAAPTEAGTYEVWAEITDHNYRHADATDGTARKIGVLTIYRQAAPTTYTATFAGGEGATGTAPTPQSGLLAGSVIVLPNAGGLTKADHAFAGWKLGNSVYQSGETYTMTAGNITFTAQWKTNVYTISGVVDQNNQPISDVTVTLMLGGQQIAETVTDSRGQYTFSSVTPGIYNLVASRDGVTMTIKVEITDRNATANIQLPAGKTNSIVEIKPGAATAVVGNLETVFTDNTIYTAENQTVVAGGGSVEIKLTVDTTELTDGQTRDMQSKASGYTLGQELALTVKKTVTGSGGASTTTNISDTGVLLETTLLLPAALQGKDSYTVLRLHDGAVHTLTTSPNADGEYFTVNADKTAIIIHARYYSAYVIAWRQNSFSGGGGSSSSTTYPVTVLDSSPDGGKVSASHKSASKGETVTITVDADDGYELDKLTVKDKNGNKLPVTTKGNGKYTFEMPSGSVTIEAAFKESVWNRNYSDCPKDNTCPIWPYTDARMTDWYHDGVHFCLENGLMVGYGDGIFKPNAPTTRSMLVVMLWRLNGSPIVNYALDFEDVKEGTWYTEAVRWAKSEGVAGGYGNGKFGPGDTLTREQMVTILYRYAQYKGNDVSAGEDTNILSFSDATTVAEYAIPAMQWACGSGMITGKNAADGGGLILDPKGSTTRAQMATMMMRFCAEIVK